MSHARSILAGGVMLALAACDSATDGPGGGFDLAALGLGGPTGLGNRGGGPYAPDARPARGESVDGLIVGHRLMAAGEYELALDAYTRSALEHGITVDVLSALGSANLKLGRLGQAEDLLRQAVDKDASFAPAWNNLGVILMETGKTAEAARVFRIAYGLDAGRSASIRENLTLALAKLEDINYDPDDEATFELMRRGHGNYLLLARQ